jgi:plastocyanin
VLLLSSFNPVALTVARGTTVTWRNASIETHTVTPDGHTQFSRRETTAAGVVFSQRFDVAGTFRYYCEQHGSPGAGMNGRIVVQ